MTKTSSAVEAMRSRELSLIDREELEHYHRIVGRSASRQTPQIGEEAKQRIRQEKRRMLLGDKSALTTYRAIRMHEAAMDYYDDKRKGVKEMTADQLLEKRRQRIDQAQQGQGGVGF